MQGELRSLQIDELKLDLGSGFLRALSAYLQGRPAAHIAVKGLRIVLHAAPKGPRRPRRPRADADADHDARHDAAAVHKTVSKASKILHKLLSVTLDVSQIAVVVQPAGLVIDVPRVTWKTASPDAARDLGWALAVREPSVSLLPASGQEGEM